MLRSGFFWAEGKTVPNVCVWSNIFQSTRREAPNEDHAAFLLADCLRGNILLQHVRAIKTGLTAVRLSADTLSFRKTCHSERLHTAYTEDGEVFLYADML